MSFLECVPKQSEVYYDALRITANNIMNNHVTYCNQKETKE